jgi:hypothetical protein
MRVIDMRQPVLCICKKAIPTGAGRVEIFVSSVMIHVFRSSEIEREFDIAMRAQGAKAWELLAYHPQCGQPEF